MQSSQAFKALFIYGTVVALAILMGYVLASPLSYTNLGVIAGIMFLLVVPLILRWHHPLLLFSWNMTAVVPLVPGRLQLWMLLAFLSLLISVLQYVLTRKVQFVKSPSILYPILFLGLVVFVTAAFTGGIGMRVLGSENIGGRKYLMIFTSICGYLAITAQRIPKGRANLYLGLFLLGAVTNAVGNALPYVPEALYPIFMMFPVESQGIQSVVGQNSVFGSESISRFFGLSIALMALSYFLVARYGLDKLLSFRRPVFWLFLLGLVASALGGFRTYLIFSLLTVAFVFLLEGIHRSRKMPALVAVFILLAVVMVAFSDRMPRSIQRSLSFLPLKVDPMVRLDAQGSTDWRLEMWRDLLPEVPRHLILGKGLSVTASDLDAAETLARQGLGRTSDVAMLAGDFHNGPLSVVIPFGIWGVMGWIWFVVAGTRALYANYKHSPTDLKTINTFLFGYFGAKMVLFHVVFGFLPMDLQFFVGILGFSVALNGGILRSAPALKTIQELPDGPLTQRRLVPSFSNSLRR